MPQSPRRPTRFRLLPGGQLHVPHVEAALPLETRRATDAWAAGLSEAELTELVEHHVLLLLQTSAWGTLDTPEWRTLAEVLLSEVVRRREAQVPLPLCPRGEAPPAAPGLCAAGVVRYHPPRRRAFITARMRERTPSCPHEEPTQGPRPHPSQTPADPAPL